MRIQRVLFVTAFGSLLLVPALATAEQPGAAVPSTRAPAINVAQTLAIATIPLPCSGPGSSDVVSRKHSIKNDTGATITKGTSIHWVASNNGSGNVVLTNDLPTGQSIDVIEPGQTNGYNCTASFIPGPADFAVTKVQWTGATTAVVEIANKNNFTEAKASVVRVQSMKCLVTQVSSVDLPVPVIPKGGTVSVTVNNVPKTAADYLQATANVNNAVPESSGNKGNNVGKSPEFGSNKSCTPQ